MKSKTQLYLPFVRQTVDAMEEKQSARLGGKPDGVRFITISLQPSRAYTSIGIWDHDHYQLYDIPAVALQPSPAILDFDAWPLLDRLSRVSRDPRHARWVDEMVKAFVEHGFDPQSGLLYHGQMSRFDVVKAAVVGTGVTTSDAYFKPLYGTPADRLWLADSNRMARCGKAAYFGLVTRPETMDFNRYCHYGFDDRERRNVTAFNPMHRGFVYTGALLIQYWVMNHVRTGDAESLAWTQAMADKWTRLQHPKTGLLPHFIGALSPDDKNQSPSPYANVMDAEVSIMFLEAAKMLAQKPETAKLASQLTDLGVKSLKGIARYGYDSSRRIFPDWLKLEGGEYTDEAQYAFRTQPEKEVALKRDPQVARVSVFPGESFYVGPSFHSWIVVGRVPRCIAQGAALTRDPEVTASARVLAEEIMREARARTSPLNADNQWCFPATGNYIRLMLALRDATDSQEYLKWARELADIEVKLLAEKPVADLGDQKAVEWWRIPGRDNFLEALLMLEE